MRGGLCESDGALTFGFACTSRLPMQSMEFFPRMGNQICVILPWMPVAFKLITCSQLQSGLSLVSFFPKLPLFQKGHVSHGRLVGISCLGCLGVQLHGTKTEATQSSSQAMLPTGGADLAQLPGFSRYKACMQSTNKMAGRKLG